MSDESIDQTRVALLVRHIEGDKEMFLADLKSAVLNRVSSKTPAQCLELVTTRQGSSATWKIWDNVAYVQRLVAYLRKKPYKQDGREYEVDSVMTGEILELTTSKISQHILSHQEVIADVAMTEMLLRDSTREEFLAVFLKGKTGHVLTEKGKSMIAASLLQGLHDRLSHFSVSVASNVGEKVSHLLALASKSAIITGSAEIVTKLIATSSGKIVLARLSVLIAHSIGPVIAKFLAVPAVEFALKKMIFAAVLGTMAKLIAAKIGMSIGAAIWIVLLPVLLGFLAKDIYDLPQKLGAGLAETISSDMRSTYSQTIGSIVTELLVNFTSKQAVHSLAERLADDPEISSQLGALISAVAAECAS